MAQNAGSETSVANRNRPGCIIHAILQILFIHFLWVLEIHHTANILISCFVLYPNKSFFMLGHNTLHTFQIRSCFPHPGERDP